MRTTTLALFLALATTARAQPLHTLTQTGYLLDSSDLAVNASLSMTFAIYEDTGGSGAALWTETLTVPVLKGYYAAVLGRTTPFPAALASKDPLYLSVTLDAKELLPRVRLSSVPFAWRAQGAAVADAVTDGGVKTAAIANDAVTLAKLERGLRNAGGKLDADTLDGFDSAAFAPAAIEGKIDSIDARLGAPPDGSSLAGELAAMKATGAAGAKESTLEALAAAVGSVPNATLAARADAGATDAAAVKASLGSLAGATVAARTDSAATDAAAVKTALGSIAGATVAARTDSAATDAAAVKTALGSIAGATVGARVEATYARVGAPVGASVSADIAALTTAVAALQTSLNTYVNDRKWKRLGGIYTTFNTLLGTYPTTDWEWGVIYNGGTVVPVTINSWNTGIRVTSAYPYAAGDVPSSMWMGGFAFFRDITTTTEEDACNNQNLWLHTYTRPYTTGTFYVGGNGCVNPDFYVRRW